MIKKEAYMTREDGVQLFRTFSDTEHKIRSTTTGEVYSDAIDVYESKEYEEVEDYIDVAGPETYEEVLAVSENIETVSRKINRIGLSDNEALSVKEMYPRWEDKVDHTIEAGYITLYNNNLWRARQTHMALAVYPPSIDTASLYEVVVYQHEGTESDPIPYTPPMEIFEGKYYIEDGVVYRCNRGSGVPITHALKDLVGIYVEEFTVGYPEKLKF